MTDRKHIPASLERELMIESGYGCAICKIPEPLQIDHIEEYVIVKEHKFENMIVLCANCHQRKSNKANPRKIDHIALKKFKSNLMMLNGRYSDLEKRFLERAAKLIKKNPEERPTIVLDPTVELLFYRLLEDEYVQYVHEHRGSVNVGGEPLNRILLRITPEGKAFLSKLEIFSMSEA